MNLPPHFNLQAAKRLNPNLQCWRWEEGFQIEGRYVPGYWAPVDNPKWLPHRVYALTSNDREEPLWTPTPEDQSKPLRKNTGAGKKPIC
jgi:hypothetical protein